MNNSRYNLKEETMTEMYMILHNKKINIIKSHKKRSYIIIEKDKARSISLLIEAIVSSFNNVTPNDHRSNFIDDHDLNRIANNLLFITLLNIASAGYMRCFLTEYIAQIFSFQMSRVILPKIDYLATVFLQDLKDDLVSAVFFVEDVIMERDKLAPITIVALKY